MKPVIVTTSWDDGHKLDLRLAAMLKRYDIKATFYISPEDHEFPAAERLTAEEIRQLARDFEIGAHTMTHPHLDRLDASAARREIADSKEALEFILGDPVRSFSYPYGNYNEETKRLVREAGFTSARTVERFVTRSADRIAAGTSVDTFDHRRDGMMSVLRLCGQRPWQVSQLRRWDNLAKVMFVKARDRGEVFHLWGHSHQLETRSGWERLEAFLMWLRAQQNIVFCCNGDVPSPAPRLLITVPYFKPRSGGLEEYAYRIAKGLQQTKGWEIAVVASGGKEEKFLDSYEGIKTYYLTHRLQISNTPLGLGWFTALKRIIAIERPDIIVAHAPVPGMVDITAARAKRIPLVVTYHTGSMLKGHNPVDLLIHCYENRLLPHVLRQARWIICASGFVRSSPVIAPFISKSSVISPGTDTNLFRPTRSPEEAGHRLMHVGGLRTGEQHKGLDISLRVTAELKQTYPDVQLTVVGSGDLQSHYAKVAERLGIAQYVKFRGRLGGREMVSAYQAADVLIAPSRNESFGLALAEAMACGLPVVASAVEGIPDLVEDGESGLLVEPDDVPGFAGKISALFDDAALSRRLSAAARRRIVREEYGWQRQVELTAQLMKALIERDHPLVGGVQPRTSRISIRGNLG